MRKSKVAAFALVISRLLPHVPGVVRIIDTKTSPEGVITLLALKNGIPLGTARLSDEEMCSVIHSVAKTVHELILLSVTAIRRDRKDSENNFAVHWIAIDTEEEYEKDKAKAFGGFLHQLCAFTDNQKPYTDTVIGVTQDLSKLNWKAFEDAAIPLDENRSSVTIAERVKLVVEKEGLRQEINELKDKPGAQNVLKQCLELRARLHSEEIEHLTRFITPTTTESDMIRQLLDGNTNVLERLAEEELSIDELHQMCS